MLKIKFLFSNKNNMLLYKSMITKSDFMIFANCSKEYWLSKNRQDLMKPLSDDAQKHIEDGIKVGQVARQYFDNTFIAARRKSDGTVDIGAQIAATQVALSNNYPCVAEASFQFEDLFCAVDLLKADPEGGFSIIEVKATNTVKEDHFEDIAFQKYVLEKCGLKINRLYILHLNHMYERHGDINPKMLLVGDEVSNEEIVLNTLNELEDSLNKIRILQKEKSERPVELGPKCKDCPFYENCHKNIPSPSALDINGVRKSKAYEFINAKVYSYADLLIHGFIPSNYRQQVQIESEITGKTPIFREKELTTFLSKIKYPVYHLDFETMNEAIPPVDGTHSYDQVPFQYSLHIEMSPNGKLIHKEFLGDKLDCQRELAEQLCKDIPMDGTTLAYNMTFERTVLYHLAEQFPDLAKHLLAIRENMIDLLVPFKQGIYYDKAQGGSNSIKYVMPALCPDMAEAYHELPVVHNGGEALAMFPKLVKMTGEEYKKTRQGMLDYCCLDTLSMVRVLNKLWDTINNK